MRVPHRTALAAWLLVCAAPVAAQGLPGATVTDSTVGYIDPALVATTVRLRYDSAFKNNRPSRAEFFYPQAGSPFAPGPPLPETAVDYQEASAYAEVCILPGVSVFLDAPVRFFNGQVNANSAGLSDVNAGFKVALVEECDRLCTFQFRTYAPTGDADRGLGNDHVSLEPAILFLNGLTEAITVEGEARAWVPVGGTSFAGNILRYGLGVSYRVPAGEEAWVAPVAEVVGWTVLDGKESPVPFPAQDAAGDTIVNAKLGLRVGLAGVGSVYAGYGRPLTGEVWYENIWRLEVRLNY